MSEGYERGAVVKGPYLLADYDYCPYICWSDDSHPFHNEKVLYAAIEVERKRVLRDNGLVGS
ncbi:hypothetical protein [Halobaculum magnesiiphilum]|uniref:Uncharacterized protein n=1 Tax=Halobaculum magnesiiphilum TaxID=1017351 RepID=A0A8T8WHI8_9EURY|nr:hypothetical protein [Halobaculum magnesiiphilum]QZP39204.1 hypothetical protein K6T50_16215 [Halobaculum magnesiiphilum]